MYQVSQDYMTKAFNISKKRRAIRAFLDDVAFNENDVVSNTLKYTWQAVGGADINLGGVFLGQLWLTFTKPFAAQIQRGSWKGKKITLEIGLEIGIDENQIGTEIVNGEEIPVYEYVPIIEYVPIGEYFIEEANHTMDGVEITAYDAMRKFDKNLNLSSTSGTFFSLISFACGKCGVRLGMTRAEIEALPNGTEVLSIYPENDMKTYRDLISWIGVTAGCYATITREGTLVFRGWKSESDITMGINDRYEKGTWSDFRTFYTGLSVTNIADQTTSYYHVSPDNGLTMNIGANPLLQYGLAETKTRQRMAILNALSNFNYVPFKVSAFADVFLDLGDIITFTDGLAGTSSKGCVMRIDFTFAKGITMQGFGENPALFGAQSKTDKDISGLASQNKGNEIKYQIYANTEDIDLPRDPRYSNTLSTENGGREEIAELTFTTQRETAVEVQAVVRPLTKMSRQQIEYRFRQNQIINITRTFDIVFELDGEEVESYRIYDYPVTRPMPSASEGVQPYIPLKDMMEHFFALLNVEAGTQKTLRVYVEFEYFFPEWNSSGSGFYATNTLNGNIHFDPSDIKIYLKGQGLSIEPAWDGFIIVDDSLVRHTIGIVDSDEITEEAEVTLIIPLSVSVSDQIPNEDIGAISQEAMDESLNIILVRPTNNIVTEDDLFNIVTEDGLNNIVTE